MIYAGELLTVAIAAALVIVYLRAEPLVRVDPVMRDVCQIGACMAFFIVGASAFWPLPTRIQDLLLTEPYQGVHKLSYLAIALVFAVGFYYWRDPFRATLTAALFATIHEGIFFIMFYGAQPWLLWADPLLGDRAYILWMLCVIALYWKKGYFGKDTCGLWVVLVMAGLWRLFQMGQWGLYEKSGTLRLALYGVVGWLFIAAVMLLYIHDNKCEPRW
jgi:hypothetical protein